MRRLIVCAGVLALVAVASAGAGRPESNGDIAFVSDRRGADNLYVVQPDGTGVRELTHSFAAAADLHVSRDRRQVVYSRIDGVEKTEIWSATTTGTNPRRILAARGLVSNMEPAWSPDGKRLAFIRQDGEQDTSFATAFVVTAAGTGLRRITPAGREVTEPAWSPDGKWIAVSDKYSSGANDRPCGIAIVRVDGSRFHKVPIRGRMCATDPTWSPDGRRIAFAGGDSLYVVRRDGTGVQRVARRRRGQILTPEWSPDGRHIAFAFFAYEGGGGGIYAVRPSGSGLRRLGQTKRGQSPSWMSNRALLFVRNGDLWRASLSGRAVRLADHHPAGTPAWSPDGGTLLFTAWNRPDDPNVYEIPARGGRWRSILVSWRKDSDPTWSPDGKRIAFTRGGRFVWTADRNGRGQKRVVEGIDPDWSPDGSRLAYAVAAVWTISPDGRSPRRLTPRTSGYPRSNADWSPDGQRITFTRPPVLSGDSQVWIVNADGTGLRLFIRNAYQATWSRDGQLIAFVRNGDIWVRRIADGTESLLAGGPHAEHSPAWGPAGA